MKYQMRKDGTVRATLWVRLDLQKSDIDELRERAKEDGLTLHGLLGVCLDHGIDDLWEENNPSIILDGDEQ